MDKAATKTLHTWTTQFSADSVEWCPIDGYHSVLVCGTYHLVEDEQSKDAGREDQVKFGKLYLFFISSKTTDLQPIQTIDTAAILDQKWCSVPINNSPYLAIACSTGCIQIYKLIKRESYQLQLVTEYKLNSENKALALSLDWSNSEDTIKIIVSDSAGSVSVIHLVDGTELVAGITWKAHNFEAWICAFNFWNPSMAFTGGDDCTMKVFDLRCGGTAIAVNRTHQAGVTSIHFNTRKDYLFVSGSYDEKLRSWDARKIKEPLSETELGGGIWRLKWDPFQQNILLAACMYGGFRIVHCADIQLPNIIAEYNQHKSIAYGSDWCYDRNFFKRTPTEESFYATIATCSFYDCKLDIVEIKYSCI